MTPSKKQPELLIVASDPSVREKTLETLSSIPKLGLETLEDPDRILEHLEPDPPTLVVLDSKDISTSSFELLVAIDALKLSTRLAILTRPEDTDPGLNGLFALRLWQAPVIASAVWEDMENISKEERRLENRPGHGARDYLLMASLGKCSISLHCTIMGEDAIFEIVEGEVWSAFFGEHTGAPALAQVLGGSVASAMARQLSRKPKDRQMNEDLLTLLRQSVPQTSQEMLTLTRALTTGDPGTIPIQIQREEQGTSGTGSLSGEDSVESVPAEFKTCFSRAIEAALQKDYEKAAKAFEEALEHRPRDANARFNLERVRQLLERRKNEES